jgi:sec-independent protein translocase protein TatC
MASRLKIPLGPRDEARMTLIEHLGELRSRIIKIAIAFAIFSAIGWFFRVRIFELLLAPAGDALSGKLTSIAVTEQLITDMKLALYVGFLLTIPVLLYQGWAFVAPAVGDMGRAFTYILITLASSLFLAGVAFGYFAILPVTTQFLLNWAPDRFETMITSQSYLQFTSRFLLACGLVFELPAATYVGARLELIDAPLLKRYRKHAIVANLILAAAITPTPDPFTMFLMGGPMIAMYELSILVARYVNPTTEVQAHELARAQDDDEESDEDVHYDEGYEDEEDPAEDYDEDGYDSEPHEENGQERDL